MSKQSPHFIVKNAHTVAVGGKFLSQTYFQGYFWFISIPLDTQSESAFLRPSTVAVGGKHGRGRGKTRSRSGENTVAVGGNFTLETLTVGEAAQPVSGTCVLPWSPLWWEAQPSSCAGRDLTPDCW